MDAMTDLLLTGSSIIILTHYLPLDGKSVEVTMKMTMDSVLWKNQSDKPDVNTGMYMQLLKWTTAKALANDVARKKKPVRLVTNQNTQIFLVWEIKHFILSD